MVVESTRVSQVTPESPGIPYAMVYGLLRALPGDRLVDTVTGEKLRPLDAGTEASGPHGLAVRKTALSSEALPASTASHRAFRDVRNAPLVGWDGPIQAGDLPEKESEIFLFPGLDMISENRKLICPSAKLRHRRSEHKYNLCQDNNTEDGAHPTIRFDRWMSVVGGRRDVLGQRAYRRE